jgi:hypothetical protein
VAVAALAVWPMIINATKALKGDQKDSVPTFPWTL